MKDIVFFAGVFVAGYIVSMGVLYFAFRVFFPVKVEKAGSELKFDVQGGQPVMKISKDSRTGRSTARTHKVNVAHG